MEDEEFSQHVDEVMGLINDGTPREKIIEELKHNIDYYRLTIGDSKRRVVRLHGGSAESIIGDLTLLKISDISVDGTEYNIKAKIESVTTGQRGGKPVTTGIAADDTGKINILIWEEVDIETGKIYVLKKCRYNERYSNIGINYGSNIIPVDGGSVKTNPKKRMMNFAINLSDLDENSEGKTICALVYNIMEATTKTGKSYLKITFKDDTGTATFSDWDNHGLKIGSKYIVTNIHVKVGNDRTFYSLGKNSKITMVDG